MKKNSMYPPQAEIVLLNSLDVIQTSSGADDNSIKSMLDDESGLPTVDWKG